ncbi:MAG: oligosaccharide flippase family protein, partial [Anaerolineae bacterium]
GGEVVSRAVTGSIFSIGSQAITLVLGFVRSVLLARLLLPEHFGVVALALFYLNLSGSLRALGLHRAMVHREEINERVTATFFTMQIALLLGSLALLASLLPLLGRFYPQMPLLSGVLLALIGVDGVKGINACQETLLNRDLDFRRLATADVVAAISMTVLAPLAAWQGWGAWSLVVEQASGQMARAGVIWLYARRARLHLGWDAGVARWFWRFGVKAWVSNNLVYLIDRFDDFWVGTALGKAPLGFYSQAYEFARYPRRVVANPIASVFFPTFARLQNDRLRLSQAFFRVTSLMVRVGFWFGMVFILTAPEIIHLLLGERWLPMLTTFQLMIVYTLVDPLTVVGGNLLMATGHPGQVARARAVQLAVFVPAVVGLGRWRGIEGVALAADLMVLAGLVLLFLKSRALVDYSFRALWLWPGVALALIAAVMLALSGVWERVPLWGRLLGKGAVITVLYGGLLWLTEKEQLKSGWRMIRRAVKSSGTWPRSGRGEGAGKQEGRGAEGQRSGVS